MHLRTLFAAGAVATILFSAGAANAALTFIGSWRLNDGPADPAAASAQQIAAQLFGGDPGDYFISTAGESAGLVNHLAWYRFVDSSGLVIEHEGASTFSGQGISAYVSDTDIEDRLVNYAFKDSPG